MTWLDTAVGKISGKKNYDEDNEVKSQVLKAKKNKFADDTDDIVENLLSKK